MSTPLEERYFVWLYAHIIDPDEERPDRNYWKLARQLHNKEFVYIVANDDNRWLDGRLKREQFLVDWDDDSGEPVASHWLGLACSMLEMLIALAERLEFQTDEEMSIWFWRLIDNIGLGNYNDKVYNKTVSRRIDEVLDRVIWRNYSYSGEGGLFPLKRADSDQRQLEIWYQMHSYLLEA